MLAELFGGSCTNGARRVRVLRWVCGGSTVKSVPLTDIPVTDGFSCGVVNTDYWEAMIKV